MYSFMLNSELNCQSHLLSHEQIFVCLANLLPMFIANIFSGFLYDYLILLVSCRISLCILHYAYF